MEPPQRGGLRRRGAAGRDDRWSVGGAVRVERFDLFGATANGKLSAWIGLGDAVSLRGGASTGFRAPTPGQQNTINVQTFLIDQLELTDSGTVPSTFAAARRHSGVPLRPETSCNVTAGLVADNGPFTLTADYLRVAIADRLALSGVISTDAEDRTLLLADGITAAESTDFSTRTQGIDVVSTWTPPALSGDMVLSFTMNHTPTRR